MIYFDLRHSATQTLDTLSTIITKYASAATSESLKGALLVEKAKFAYQVNRDTSLARELFREAVILSPASKLVSFSYLLFELSTAGKYIFIQVISR